MRRIDEANQRLLSSILHSTPVIKFDKLDREWKATQRHLNASAKMPWTIGDLPDVPARSRKQLPVPPSPPKPKSRPGSPSRACPAATSLEPGAAVEPPPPPSPIPPPAKPVPASAPPPRRGRARRRKGPPWAPAESRKTGDAPFYYVS